MSLISLLHNDPIFSLFPQIKLPPPNIAFPIDVIENSKNIEITADLPGFKLSDINIEYQDGQINISAERFLEKVEDKQYYYKERYLSKVNRVFTVPTNVNVDEINATLDNGVLHITIPKIPVEPVKVKKVSITNKK